MSPPERACFPAKAGTQTGLPPSRENKEATGIAVTNADRSDREPPFRTGKRTDHRHAPKHESLSYTAPRAHRPRMPAPAPSPTIPHAQSRAAPAAKCCTCVYTSYTSLRPHPRRARLNRRIPTPCAQRPAPATRTTKRARGPSPPRPFPTSTRRTGPRDYSAAAVPLAGRMSRRSAIRAALPVRPRR